MAWPFGTRVKCPLTVKTPTGSAYADPGSLTVIIKQPGGIAQLQPAYGQAGTPIVKDAVGQYSVIVVGTVAGTWKLHWDGGDPNGGGLDQQFVIDPPVTSI